MSEKFKVRRLARWECVSTLTRAEIVARLVGVRPQGGWAARHVDRRDHVTGYLSGSLRVCIERPSKTRLIVWADQIGPGAGLLPLVQQAERLVTGALDAPIVKADLRLDRFDKLRHA